MPQQLQPIVAFLDGLLQPDRFQDSSNTARHYQMNALFSGHYATESLGVQALGKLLTRRFGVRTEFVDLGIRF